MSIASARPFPRSARGPKALLCLLATLLLALAPIRGRADDPMAGDVSADPGPRAQLSGTMRPDDIRRAVSLVAAWQYARVHGHDSLDWTFAPLYLGFLGASDLLHDPRYARYVRTVGEHKRWGLGPRAFHADDQAVAQAWLALHARDPDPDAAMLKPLRDHHDAQMREPDNAPRPLWWWCDALFMAPPTWAGLARATHERAYLDFMDRQWWITSALLYDPVEHLYSRDASYLHQHEANGRKLFWSRGNGWVMAGLARVLADLPADYPSRTRYVGQFRAMAARLVQLQGKDGLWRAGLLDAAAYPRPETSGSAFIVYALAWGVRHGLLEAATYRPAVARGWRGLVGEIYADGRLGDIQPIGAAPGDYPPGASYVYGVGAFLLAAGEVAAAGHGGSAMSATPDPATGQTTARRAARAAGRTGHLKPASLRIVLSTMLLLGVAPGMHAAGAAPPATAWRDGRFHADVAGVVGRSDIVLHHPNHLAGEAMPLGNGRLGLAAWSADGLTLQLNRADTLPGRLSPGQVVLPGLKRLVDAPDYAGRLDLYRGEFRESGGGMTAMVYVQPDTDVAVIEVHGADPSATQTVRLHLWPPRKPQARARGEVATLAETWTDSGEPGASGQTFGSLAAITAQARDVRSAVVDGETVELSFRPNADGSFRVLVAAPAWNGGDAMPRAEQLLARAARVSATAHRDWWNAFWQRAGLMKLDSADGIAAYMENLRAIDLYATAAESRGPLPGSQAGIADLFASTRDEHRWAPSAYWHWNLRMQVAANLGAGLYDLNLPYFNLYRSNLANIEAWTREQMDGRPGACVPETMRFNGAGYESESWLGGPGLNCSAKSPPYYNARTLSTGAEVSLWIWRQFLATQDRAFLAANYPVMAASARFLLAYARTGADGRLHTFPSNAHETQWDGHDPTTDIAAMKALFPAVIAVAGALRTDAALVGELQQALPKIPPFPLVKTGDDSVIGVSADEHAKTENSENIGLEPVWPYGLIGDSGPQHALGVRTWQRRPNKFANDWSFDPLDAARLGLADEMKTALVRLTEKYQAYPSGFAKFTGAEFYVEQIGVVAAALQEALVQDHDGLIRIAPAWPGDWDADATVHVRSRGKVDLQMRDGVPVTVVIEAGADAPFAVRDPWPGHAAKVVESRSGQRLATTNDHGVLRFHARAGTAYVLRRVDRPSTGAPFAAIEGSPATAPKSLGTRHIGMP